MVVLFGEKAIDSTTPQVSPKTKPKRSFEAMSKGQSRILQPVRACHPFTLLTVDLGCSRCSQRSSNRPASRHSSWPVRSQHTQKMLPRVLEEVEESAASPSSSRSCFTRTPCGDTHRFWSALKVQIRTRNQVLREARHFLSLDPTAKALPSGDHLQHRAALWIFSTTKVGSHFPFS